MVLITDEEVRLIRNKFKDQRSGKSSVLKSEVLTTFHDILGHSIKPELQDRLDKFLKEHKESEINVDELLKEGILLSNAL